MTQVRGKLVLYDVQRKGSYYSRGQDVQAHILASAGLGIVYFSRTIKILTKRDKASKPAKYDHNCLHKGR